MEHEVLTFWKNERIFDKLRDKNKGRKHWSFVDGPITANNPMGVHHAWGRTYKDIFQRFKAMQGFEQRYQNGFDCQGLWVEVEVEKDLGFNSKREIVDYGLDNFAAKCRQRVEKYSDIQEKQSERLGQWMDWPNSYYTMSDTNIEYIWHFLKKCSDNGWLYKGRRAMPWCARCGTSLSQHELADSYRDMKHPSVTIKLPILQRPGEYVLAWTTTPWTLTANTALAVHPELDYAKVKHGDDVMYLSSKALDRLVPGCEVLGTVKGSELVGLRYKGPFFHLPAQQEVEPRVVAWSEVSEEEGTGIVHIAPGCGQEDYALSQEQGLDVLVPIDENGVYYSDYAHLSGKNVSEVASEIIEDLDTKGMLYKAEDYRHRYPVCWRCGEELVFRLAEEWFISCSELREPMIREAGQVRWIPDYAGKRMEDWLNNMGDWCISRKRFWGLPLPFYKCSCGETTIIGSRTELEQLALSGTENLRELHRPWIDEVRIKCPRCGRAAERIPEVGDCWLDAGIVSFSTLGYLDEDNSYWRKWFPAEFVVEMREQIRLWLYSMLFVSVTLEGTAPYRSVMVYERVNDEHGRPMHKSHGNAIPFDGAAEKMGADVMRWIYAGSNIQNDLNFGYGKGKDAVRRLLTLWNVYSFFVTYALVDKWKPSRMSGVDTAQPPASELDRWILARLHGLVSDATDSLENFDAARFTRAIDAFVEDLSNWHVRLNRRRFWKSRLDQDKQSAYSTLYEVLVTLVKLLAPVLPFITETMYQNLVRSVLPDAPESVHLCDWPLADDSLVDDHLLAETGAVMKIVRLGRSARNAAGIKIRQPLALLFVKPADELERDAVERHERLILDELNVKALSMEPCEPGEDMSCVEEAGSTVGVQVALTDELIEEGVARDVVRHVQNLRKELGFNVDDRITMEYWAPDSLAEAVSAWEDYIRRETLADSLTRTQEDDSFSESRIAGEHIGLSLEKTP